MVRFVALLFVLLGATISIAEPPRDPGAALVARAAAAAEKLMQSVTKEQRGKLLFRFDDDAQRRRWSNFPTAMVQRRGLRWGDLSEAQRAAVFELMKATLSPAGVQQIRDNMDCDEVLRRNDRWGNRSRYGIDEFYVSILGTPSTTKPWMWQFGGHHLAFNVTLCRDAVSLSPMLTGGNPIRFERDGKQVRQLAAEVEAAQAFVQSLDAKQRRAAQIAERCFDVRFGPGTDDAVAVRQEGIAGSALNAAQKKLLLNLIRTRVGILQAHHMDKRMKRIATDLDETWFAWGGRTTADGNASFRIQGPTVIMEYSPQGRGSNHVHAMYRDPKNDYGATITRRK